jgi:hypothetical protein
MTRQSLCVTLAAMTLFLLPAQSARACCGWWNRMWGTPTTSYYAPYTAAYAPCASCAPYTAAYAPCATGCAAPYVASYAPACAQVVNYVPQTSYRTVYYSQPVVAYSPMTACNACGGATTVMRPVTTYVTQARVVPYTSYRPVVTAMPMATAAYYAPVATAAYYAPVAAPAAGCCGANYAPSPVTTALPVGAVGTTVQSLAPVPVPTYAGPPQGQPGPSGDPSLQRPQLNQSAPPAGTNQNFEGSPPSDVPQPNSDPSQPQSDAPQPQSRIVFPPRAGQNSNTSGAPRALDPEAAMDQTTALPLRQTVAARPVSTVSPTRPAASKADDGWRSARQ